MRTLVIIFCLMLIINLKIFSQVNDTTDIIIDPIEEMPVFPGGFDSIWCFLERNFHYDILNTDNKKVKYITRFIIDTLGKATNVEIIGSLPRNIIFDHQDSLKISEIFRVIELMETWEPAKLNNKKVRCLYSIPVMTPYTEFKCDKFKNKGKIENRPDSLAQFKFGNGITNQERINNFLYSNLIWPKDSECTGRVVIKCVIEKSGQLSNFAFVRQLCPELDAEALRILKIMPNWHPAIKDNKPVRSVVVIPILFRLQ